MSIEELNRQLIEYRNLVDDKKYFNVDVSKSPEEIVNKLSEIILRKVNED